MLKCGTWSWIGPHSGDGSPKGDYWDKGQMGNTQNKTCPINGKFLDFGTCTCTIVT